MSSGLRVLLAGGGTGGHLRPALTLAEALNKESTGVAREQCGGGEEETQSLLLVSGRDVEKNFSSTLRGIRVEPLFKGWTSRPPPWRLDVYAKAWRRVRSLRRDFKPDVTLLFGGYVSALALAGRVSLHPTLLFESNAVPGKVARFLARRVHSIVTEWRSTVSALAPLQSTKETQFFATGMPVERSFSGSDQVRARAHFQIPENAIVLLVLGGSQGALGVNRIAAKALPRLGASIGERPIHVLVIAGVANAESMRATSMQWPMKTTVIPFCNEMELAYAASDLAICRAGGMTVAELSASATPSILIPYPYHADQHQKANAMELVNVGAAHMVEESDQAEDQVFGLMSELLHASDTLSTMRQSARDSSRPNSLRDAVNAVMTTVDRINKVNEINKVNSDSHRAPIS